MYWLDLEGPAQNFVDGLDMARGPCEGWTAAELVGGQ